MGRFCMFCLAVFLVVRTSGADEPQTKTPKRNAAKVAEGGEKAADEKIDFDRARQLLRKKKSGEKLTAEENAYLDRAIEARGKGRTPGGGNRGGDPRMLSAVEKTGLKPLDAMSAEDRYLKQDGGLYGGGKNEPPASHLKAAEKAVAKIQPLDSEGQPAADGRIVLISISMSNATQEFSRFKQIADADKGKSAKVTIVDCAQGGQAMAAWVSPDARPWAETKRRLDQADVTPAQVQAAWIKLANKAPRGSFEEHGRQLERDTRAVIQNAKAKFPNLQVAYLSSRSYGGYAAGPLNPEPFAYESAYVVRWLIQDQIEGGDELSIEDSKAPVLLWGPYLWADGVTPRPSDQLMWTRDDFAGDGTHPSNSGRTKVAKMLLSFFKTNPLAKGWFTGN